MMVLKGFFDLLRSMEMMTLDSYFEHLFMKKPGLKGVRFDKVSNS
jgi:hypothetical protein